jgi:excisionase family DNA binding protein
MVLSVKQMALLLGCSEMAVYNRALKRQLPHRKMGKRVIFLKAEVERFLDELPGMRLEEMR